MPRRTHTVSSNKRKMARILGNGQLTFSTAVRTGRGKNIDPVMTGTFCMTHAAHIPNSLSLFSYTVKMLRCFNTNKWSFHNLEEAEIFQWDMSVSMFHKFSLTLER